MPLFQRSLKELTSYRLFYVFIKNRAQLMKRLMFKCFAQRSEHKLYPKVEP